MISRKRPEYPASLWESSEFQEFNEKTCDWPAAWVFQHANMIFRLADDAIEYQAAWKAALDGLKLAEASAEDSQMDEDDKKIFFDDAVQQALEDHFFSEGN